MGKYTIRLVWDAYEEDADKPLGVVSEIDSIVFLVSLVDLPALLLKHFVDRIQGVVARRISEMDMRLRQCAWWSRLHRRERQQRGD